jgi:hypothetical protein
MQTLYDIYVCSQWHTVIHISPPRYIFFRSDYYVSCHLSNLVLYLKNVKICKEFKGWKYMQSYGRL